MDDELRLSMFFGDGFKAEKAVIHNFTPGMKMKASTCSCVIVLNMTPDNRMTASIIDPCQDHLDAVGKAMTPNYSIGRGELST